MTKSTKQDDPTEKDLALRRLYNRFNALEGIARTKARHPSNIQFAEYVAKMEMEAMTWALAKDLVKEELLNDGA